MSLSERSMQKCTHWS